MLTWTNKTWITILFNKCRVYTLYRVCTLYTIQFPFKPPSPMTTTNVDIILQKHTSGNFTVSGCIKWLGLALKPEDKLELNDSSVTINILVGDQHIQQVEESPFYKLTNCKLNQFRWKRLGTTFNITVVQAQKQDMSNVQRKEQGTSRHYECRCRCVSKLQQ